MELDLKWNESRLELPQAWIDYRPNWLKLDEAEALFKHFLGQGHWQQSNITIYGKTYATPRLEAYYAESGQNYGYSGKQLKVNPLNGVLLELKQRIENEFNLSFNAVLLNLYRDGMDSNGWHADNEPELGRNPQIASLSLGASRRFDLKHTSSGQKIQLPLTSGSLLVMGGEMQHFWKHQIPKTSRVNSPRINLTFRKIIP